MCRAGRKKLYSLTHSLLSLTFAVMTNEQHKKKKNERAEHESR